MTIDGKAASIAAVRGAVERVGHVQPLHIVALGRDLDALGQRLRRLGTACPAKLGRAWNQSSPWRPLSMARQQVPPW